MSNYYTGVLALTVLNMVLLCLLAISNHMMKRSIKKYFIAAFIVVIFGAIFEWGAVYLQVNSNLVWLHTLVKTVELCITPAIPLVLFSAISKNRLIKTIMFWLVAINTIIEIHSAFFGFVFYVDANNIYHHGNHYFLYVISYCIGGLLLALGAILTFKDYQSRPAKLIVLEILFVFFGVTLQMLDKTIRVDFLATSMALSFLYVQYQDVIQSSDSLTKLLNRNSYDNKLKSIENDVVIINIDIDDFKKCNDHYGHLYGDKCLSITASAIMEVFSKHGLCYRIGGDEFCVIINSKVIPTENIDTLHKIMKQNRLTEPNLPSLSTGYALFSHKTQNIIESVEKADTMMYKFKKIRKDNLAKGIDLSYKEIQSQVQGKL